MINVESKYGEQEDRLIGQNTTVVSIAGKSVKESTDRKLTRRNSTEAIIRNLPQKHVGKSSILYVNFLSKLQKNSTCVCSGHTSTVHWKNIAEQA